MTIFIIAAIIVGGILLHRWVKTSPLKALDYVTIQQGDITKMGFKCIVNAANRFGLGGGGVDGAIHRAAGPQLKQWIRDNVPCWETQGEDGLEYPRIDTGDNIVTQGFNLCETIIHTVGPIYSADNALECRTLLTDCYVGAIEAAKEAGHKEVAFPLISAGIYGYPKEEAAVVAVTACALFGYVMGVRSTIVAYDQETLDIITQAKTQVENSWNGGN